MQANTFKRSLGLILLCMLVTGGAPQAAGTVHYRWVDDRGNPVHSDRPPPSGIDYEVIDSGSKLKRVVSGKEGAVPPEVSPRVGNEFDPAAQETVRPQKNPELCKRAQANLSALTGRAKVRLRDDQGELRVLTEEEKDAEREKARAQIDVYCP